MIGGGGGRGGGGNGRKLGPVFRGGRVTRYAGGEDGRRHCREGTGGPGGGGPEKTGAGRGERGQGGFLFYVQPTLVNGRWPMAACSTCRPAFRPRNWGKCFGLEATGKKTENGLGRVPPHTVGSSN